MYMDLSTKYGFIAHIYFKVTIIFINTRKFFLGKFFYR